MTLRQWLEAQNLLQKEFARQTGICEPTISRIVNGRIMANLADAARIIRATNGAVPLESLIRAGRTRAA